jgi:hypothetical protein
MRKPPARMSHGKPTKQPAPQAPRGPAAPPTPSTPPNTMMTPDLGTPGAAPPTMNTNYGPAQRKAGDVAWKGLKG